ncbi:gloverin-like [Leptidea sinapis]|uniref:Attacin C-terminal domain-containing protein n=1 Tax=Leptidea sinapis TaxID=189913 RepID=A0A5E4QSU9_9NEOP|nr:gloverin-like [Leptidea sinapis]VVD01240.1 unnamed protein product [Leptidea sinapis]
MKQVCVLITMVCTIAAQEFVPVLRDPTYPVWYVGGAVGGTVRQRGRRDVTVDRKVGDNGKVFGTLGANDNGLFGKGGYEHQIFDDARGKLSGQLSGSRVLGPMGDASLVGGGLRYENPNAQASLDITKQIHGHTMYSAAAGGKWPVGKNGDFSVQGTYNQMPGLRDYGAMANYNYRW